MLITTGRTAPHRSIGTRLLGLTGAMVLGGIVAVTGSPADASVVAKINLNTLEHFGVLAGSTVTNTGSTVLKGDLPLAKLDLGVSPGAAVTGFPPGVILPPGVKHIADGVASQAQLDATTAYDQAAGLSADNPTAFDDLGGKVLQPGVYQGNLSLTGTLTLDNSDGPDAVFVFQASSTLITATSSVVTFTNPDHRSCNVFWQVGSSATLGTGSTFVGTIDALTSITAGTAATVQGRLVARNGAVTLDSNTITKASCALPVLSTPPTTPPTTTPPTTTPPTTTPPTTTPPTTTPSTTTLVPTSRTTPTRTSTSRTTPTTTPPPQEVTTGQSLTVIVPSTTTNRTSTRRTTSNQTSTGTSTRTGTSIRTSTEVFGGNTTPYGQTTTATVALGIDTGSGGSGELAATGAGVTGLLISGLGLVGGGGVVLIVVSGRRAIGHHRRV